MLKLRDLIIDWVQEGFQNFFRSLEKIFHLFAGGNASLMGGVQPDKVSIGLILVLAQISVFVEKNAVPRITEVMFTHDVKICLHDCHFTFS